jgi:hypothetical protein
MFKFKNPFAKTPPGVVHTLTPASATPGIIRAGKWLFVPEFNLPGILVSAKDYPLVTVMLTNEAGENFRQETFHCDKVRVAKLLEIPAARRPDPETGAALGYF